MRLKPQPHDLNQQPSGVPCTGASALVRTLEFLGVEVVFGYPGGAVLPLYDALIGSSLRHVLVRHEQGGGHAAEGYAHATGRLGVCFATSGPGATNLVTPIADAYMDSIPMLAITGQVGKANIGKDAFQEADIVGITMPITKHNYKVWDADLIPEVVAEAATLATSGRPGPVLVDIPKDVLAAATHFRSPAVSPGAPVATLSSSAISDAGDLIGRARQPVLYVGGGVLKADACPELRVFAEIVGAPVVTTLMARGAFPDSHPLCLGMPGMHGSYTAVTAMQRSDLLISVGARFDDRVTGRLDGFAPEAKVIHIDIDPAELGKNRHPDVAIRADAKVALSALIAAFDGRPQRDLSPWLHQVSRWRNDFPLSYVRDGRLKPQFVIERLGAATKGAAVVVTGVGQHQMWASQLMPCEKPRSFVTSGGLGTMGFAVPAALGAKLGRPDDTVIAIDGDGCFQMTAQELATAVIEKIPFVVAVLNNGHLGMVRQWQELFYDHRYSHVHLPPDIPDISKLAEAYGAVGFRVDSEEEVDPAIAKALEVDDRPTVIDFRVDPTEMCFPIVPAGAINDDIVLGGSR